MKALIPFLCLVFVSGAAHATDFNYHNLLLTHAKLSTAYDYEAKTDSYMMVFRADVWNRYKNDEFELEDKRNETTKIFRQRAEAMNLGEPFVINAGTKFADYDFDNGLFPIEGPGPNSYYYESLRSIKGRALPGRIKMFFTNPELVGDLEMPKDDARAFLQSRKAYNGYVNRKMTMTLKAVPVSAEGDDVIKAKLVEVKLIDQEQSDKVLATFTADD